MPTIVTLVYHAYKNFEVPNKIAKMMDDGTLKWRSHHGDMYYTDEDGKEKKIEADSEFVAWENHDEFHVEETEESDEEEEGDCLAGNPKCVKCKIHLSEDDMAVWTEDTTKEPMCEHCLDEEEEEKSDTK